MAAITQVDIAIVGGGMAGASLALMLAKFCPQLTVALLEQHPPPDFQAALQLPSFDARATAIAAGSLQIFDQLGLWPQLREHAAAITRVEVSDRGHSLGAALAAGQKPHTSFHGLLGAVVENAALGPILYRALHNTLVQLLSPAQVCRVTIKAEGAQIQWRTGAEAPVQQLSAKLLVAADGVNSPVCTQLGITTKRTTYNQQALITTLGLQQNHCGTAYERFAESGPMALLPLPTRNGSPRATLVWTCTGDEAEEIAALPEEAFIRRLQQKFGWRAGRIVRAGRIHSYPLSLSLADEQYRRGVVLVGNCAHFLHPVAGQGFNLTLRDCYSLTEIVADKLKAANYRADTAIGAVDILQAYWRKRQRDQQLTIGFSDQIPALFAASGFCARALRQTGLLGLMLIPSLRTSFVRQAAGLGI